MRLIETKPLTEWGWLRSEPDSTQQHSAQASCRRCDVIRWLRPKSHRHLGRSRLTLT